MAPITPELREEIERLHQQASAHDANLRQSAVLAPSALRRRYFSMASQIRGLFRSRGDQNHRGAPS
jgi:hypothetical protein